METQEKKREIISKFKNPDIVTTDDWGRTIVECIARGMSEYEAIEQLLELKVKQQKTIGDLSKFQPAPHVILTGDSELQLKRVYDWLMDENREPAQTAFTAGWQRNLATEIESRIINK